MKFETAEQMLKFINDNHDLYSPKAKKYVFNYNETGSICTYDIDENDAKELAEKSRICKEYWAAFLGAGGVIWDDPSHDSYQKGQASNLDCCTNLIKNEDWVLAEHYLGTPAYLKVEMTVELTQEDVDDIVCGALEGGITYWCCKVEVVEEDYYGEYASEQISRGGSLRLYDAEEDETYILDLEKFIKGFKTWVEKGYDKYNAVTSNGIDCGNIDANGADGIIQCALFGEVVFS